MIVKIGSIYIVYDSS